MRGEWPDNIERALEDPVEIRIEVDSRLVADAVCGLACRLRMRLREAFGLLSRGGRTSISSCWITVTAGPTRMGSMSE